MNTVSNTAMNGVLGGAMTAAVEVWAQILPMDIHALTYNDKKTSL